VKHPLARFVLRAAGLALVVGLVQVTTGAQDRLRTMPGYAQFQKVSAEIPGAVKLGSLAVTWSPDGKSLEYTRDGKRYTYDVGRAGRSAVVSSTLPNHRTARSRRSIARVTST
jgi:dipeptidyl-peptidase-4